MKSVAMPVPRITQTGQNIPAPVAAQMIVQTIQIRTNPPNVRQNARCEFNRSAAAWCALSGCELIS
jgi:hypothetical protein